MTIISMYSTINFNLFNTKGIINCGKMKACSTCDK